jgi:hypothetical protein
MGLTWHNAVRIRWLRVDGLGCAEEMLLSPDMIGRQG